MNTPKLISILSSPIGTADPSRVGRAADPAHGLDFSRLLGEKRSQPAVIQRPAQANTGSASRSPDAQARTAAPARHDPVRHEASAADNSRSANGSTQAAHETEAAPEAGSTQVADHSQQSNDQAGPRPQTNQPSDNDQPAGHQANAGSPKDTAGAETSQAAADSDTAQGDATTGHTQALVSADAVELATQSAEAMAESGLSALLATEPAQTGSQPTSRSHLPAGAAAQPAVPTVSSATLATAHATPLLSEEADTDVRVLPATSQAAAIGKVAGEPAPPSQLAAILPGLNSEPAVDIDTAQPHRVISGQTVLQPQAGAVAPPSAQIQAAVAQALNGIDTTAANPATEAGATASRLSTDTPATNALPLPVVAEAANSAATLSLQEFTAMVAAARASSGTALHPVAALATPGSAPLAPVPMAGLMPAGLLPGQTAMAPGAGITAPLNSPQWPTELGRQFISIAQAGNGLGQVAELRLDPPELGPLRITINLNDNVAHAVFSSPHALVRQTVENALPQLQQMLEQAGISLGQANVNDQHQSGQARQDQASGNGLQAQVSGTGATADELSGTPADRQGRPVDPNALVDTFA